MNSYTNVILRYIVLLMCLFPCFLEASTPPAFKFTKSIIATSPGETVEICLERSWAAMAAGQSYVDVVLENEIIYLPYYKNKKSVRFAHGELVSCFDFDVRNFSTDSEDLIILGTTEKARLLVEKEKKVRMCGPISMDTIVPNEDVIAVDAYGNYYSQEMIKIPKSASTVSNLNSSSSSNCGCEQLGITLDLFEPYFEDCIYGTGEGFDDPIDGPLRRETLCATLVYLESLIDPNESVCNPGEERRVNLQILPNSQPVDYPVALTPIPQFVLGYATPFYTSRNTNGIEYTWPWRIINGGEYPFLEDFYHATVRLNFTDYTWNLDYTGDVENDEYDLYSVVLHELTHAIGFVSAFNSTTGELGSREGIGRYSNFDQHLSVTYESDLVTRRLIENVPSEYGYSFSNFWSFNPLVDGLGINDPNDPSDLHADCSQAGSHVNFEGVISSYPIYSGEQFERGSSFIHLGDNCLPSVAENANYVMKVALGSGRQNRLFHWQELDVLRTIGYNINCSNADFFDDNPTDDLYFDCEESNDACSIASVNDLGDNLAQCGVSNALLSIGKCVDENQVVINRESLENLLISNDPNAMQIAFIEPISIALRDDWQVSDNDFTLNIESFGNFMFVYAPLDCNGGVANTSVFYISVFLGPGCDVPICEEQDCSDFNLPEGWEECLNYPLITNGDCSLLCNGEFNGTYALNPSLNFTTDLDYRVILYNFGAYEPFHNLFTDPAGFSKMISPTGWIKGTGTPDIVIDNSGNPAIRSGNRESVYTYLTTTPIEGDNYLFSGRFFETSSDPTVVTRIDTEVSLIQAEFYTVCSDEPPGAFNVNCYEEGAPELTIVDPELYNYQSNQLSIRIGSCLTIDDRYDALLVKALPRLDGFSSLGSVDDLELIPDVFSAGANLESPLCGTPQTLGGEVFCMLSDVHVQYDWYEVASNNLIHSYDVLNGVVNGDVSFQVAPQQTTTYRLERTILDLGGLSDDFEFCTISDEVTITVIEQFPIAEFTAQEVEGECGVFSFLSDPSSIGNNHTWYLNEQTEDAIFSTDANPTNHQLPDGVNTIIHIVAGRCGTDIFETTLPEVNCEPPTASCTCEGPDAISIDAGDGTLLSQLIANGEMPATSLLNKCLSISGDLRIDIGATGNGGYYTFYGSEVIMAPGSSITVEAGAGLLVYLKGSSGRGIHGCTALWKGISLAPNDLSGSGLNGGRLKLDAASVEDAVHGVTFGDGSSFEMRFTLLDRNYIGLYMPPSIGTQEVFQPTFPYSSTINSSGDLLPPYPGQVTQTGIDSYAGIELNDCRRFQIGGGNLGINITNSYFGIVLKHTQLDCIKSRIYNLKAVPLTNLGSTGILATDNSLVTIRDSRLLNMQNGILCNKTSLYARNNIIGEDFLGNRYNVVTGIQMQMGVGNEAQVTDKNKLFVRNEGVIINTTHLANSVAVKDNTIETFSEVPDNLVGSGISLSDALLSGNDGMQRIVSGNNVKINSTGYGITLRNVNATKIAENEVSFQGTPAGNGTYRGIRLLQASGNYVYGNRVVATDAPRSVVFGIYVSEGDQNAICCNTVKDVYYGVRFRGYCDQSKLRHTNFEDNIIGLRCDDNTRIGTQLASGNVWANNSLLDAAHYSMTFGDVFQSRFFVSGTPGTSFWPGNILVAAAGVDWFQPGPPEVSCEADQDDCMMPLLDKLAKSEQFSLKVLQGDFEYGSYPQTSDWEAKRILFRSQKATKLEDRSNWPIASQRFFQQHDQQQSELFELTTIAQSLEERLITDSLLSSISSALVMLGDEIYELDKTVVEGEDPSQAYFEVRAELLEEKTRLFEILLERIQLVENGYESGIEQLRLLNNRILTTVDAALAMKQVNNWYFETMAIGLDSLPHATEASLREMAERCPQRYGSAVGRAQAVLSHYGELFAPSDECKEGDLTEQKSSALSNLNLKTMVQPEDVVVFPNPVSSLLTIQLLETNSTESWNLELVNMRGQIVDSTTCRGGEINLHVGKHVAGIYWVRIHRQEGVLIKKIIIK